MPFGSFNRKIINTTDQRVGGSDNAQVASLGGRIFNNGGSGGGNPTAAAQAVNSTPQFIIVGVVIIAVAMVWGLVELISRK